jgi:hypothetical protein
MPIRATSKCPHEVDGPMYNFCTYFDRNYLVRGLTLYSSLERHARPFVLWVLCLDDFTYDALIQMDLPSLRPIPLQTLERDDEALLQTKEHRSQVEYYFTCTPSWLLYLLNHCSGIDSVTYLDADLFFYSNPHPIYEEMAEQSVLIVGHRFTEELADREKYGIYNVGYLSFRNDAYGRECLNWWRDRCLEWCYDRVEGGRFADQKYLDDWPVRFRKVVALQHKGGGLAPWNVDNYSLVLRDGRVLVDSDPLVFFHFHSFKKLSPRLYDPGLARHGVQVNPVLKRHTYEPYIRALSAAARSLSGLVDQSQIRLASVRHSQPATRKIAGKGRVGRRLVDSVQHRISLTKRVYHGDLWLVIGGRILP